MVNDRTMVNDTNIVTYFGLLVVTSQNNQNFIYHDLHNIFLPLRIVLTAFFPIHKNSSKIKTILQLVKKLNFNYLMITNTSV